MFVRSLFHELDIKMAFTLDAGTLFSLGVAFGLMPAAQLITFVVLARGTPAKYKYLFLWHAYDSLTHFIIEGSFLYHCFFSYTDLPNPSEPHFLGYKGRRYGPFYSDAPMARLWQEYAKADHRWGESDLTVISLEILTVGLAGPGAAYVAYLIAHRSSKTWFWATVLATGELYGGESFAELFPG